MTKLLKWAIRFIFFVNAALICLVVTTFLSFKMDHFFIEKKIVTLQNIFKPGHSFIQSLQQSHPFFEKLTVFAADTPSTSRVCFEVKKWGATQYQNSQDLRKILNYSQMLESLNNLEGCRHIEIIFQSDSLTSGLHTALAKIQIDTTGIVTQSDDFSIF